MSATTDLKSSAQGAMSARGLLGTSLPWPKVAVRVIVTACDRPTFEAAVATLPQGAFVALDYEAYNKRISQYVDNMLNGSKLPPLLAAMIRMNTMAFMSSFVANPALGQIVRELTAVLAANVKKMAFTPFLVRLPLPLVETFRQCCEACLPVHVVVAGAGGPAAAGAASGPLGLQLVPLMPTVHTPLAEEALRLASALPFSSELFAS